MDQQEPQEEGNQDERRPVGLGLGVSLVVRVREGPVAVGFRGNAQRGFSSWTAAHRG